MHIDALIFGGGAAGLWLLDELHRSGFSTLLIERDAFGAGQTVASQGIIHGGMKYALTGAQRASAEAIREMPGVWRDCLCGLCQPDLRAARVRSECCYMWRTSSLASTLGMIGARAGLRSHAERIEGADRPDALKGCPGDVYRLDEQVIDSAGMLEALAGPHRVRCLRLDIDGEVEFAWSQAGRVDGVRLKHPEGERLEFPARHVIFTAGAGNAVLRRRVGLPGDSMQRRPLHMVMARGELPTLFGHCIDGAHTRVTVTTVNDAAGRTVWQVGGQVSENGVSMNEHKVIAHAYGELTSVLPGVSFSGVEWSTYRIDRAEGRTPDGGRPADAQVLVEGNVITVWPTKLALAPHAAMLVRSHLGSPAAGGPVDPRALAHWPHPRTALPPWETARRWVTL